MNSNLAGWRGVAMGMAMAVGLAACGVDPDGEFAASEPDEAETQAAEELSSRYNRPNNTGGIGAQAIPANIGSLAGFSRIHSGYSSVHDVWTAQFGADEMPRSGYADVRGCADRLCAVHFVFRYGSQLRPVDLLVSKSQMATYHLPTTSLPLDSGAYSPRTDGGTFRAADATVGVRVVRVAVTERPPANVLYKPAAPTARANNYVTSGGLLGMMDPNNGGAGAGYSAFPMYNGTHVRTTGRTFSMQIDGNDIEYAEVAFNLANLAGPSDTIRTWVVYRWSEAGAWSQPTLQ